MSTVTLLPSGPESIDDAGHALASGLRASLVSVSSGNGMGSGTPIGDGLIVTNHHVVPGGSAIVATAAGEEFDANVIARDAAADLVLLRAPVPVEPLSLRLDPPLHVGELVYAIGNPWGERGVLTAGVVLSPGGMRADGHFAPVRADLRLAPGNSGGPMADARGRVVGINNMIVGGVAVAIPSEIVTELVRAATTRGARACA